MESFACPPETESAQRVQSPPVAAVKHASAWGTSKALRARTLATIYTRCYHSQSSLIFSHAITISRVWLYSISIGQRRGRLWVVVKAFPKSQQPIMAEVKACHVTLIFISYNSSSDGDEAMNLSVSSCFDYIRHNNSKFQEVIADGYFLFPKHGSHLSLLTQPPASNLPLCSPCLETQLTCQNLTIFQA